MHIITLHNCRANNAKLFGQPISAPVRIQDRFTSTVWNFCPRIADVFLRVSHGSKRKAAVKSQAIYAIGFSYKVYKMKLLTNVAYL